MEAPSKAKAAGTAERIRENMQRMRAGTGALQKADKERTGR